jgi:biopolymer transport protein ExbB/TolQ
MRLSPVLKTKALPAEFVYQLFALTLAFIVVHTAYVTVIRPQADAVMAEQKTLIETHPEARLEQNIFVVLKDYEQETCFVLLLWALSILAYKGYNVNREKQLLGRDLVSIPEGGRVLPEDGKPLSRDIQALPDPLVHFLLPRALLLALLRFQSTRNIQDVSTAVHTLCETEAERLDSELSMIRYIAWAIPSVGFLGTVRGIGLALGQAHQAVEGDITGVTESLGTAFNSTFVALLLSIFLMFIVHQLQLAQERLVLDVENYCDRKLISHMHMDA